MTNDYEHISGAGRSELSSSSANHGVMLLAFEHIGFELKYEWKLRDGG